jgi:hypothetical protein
VSHGQHVARVLRREQAVQDAGAEWHVVGLGEDRAVSAALVDSPGARRDDHRCSFTTRRLPWASSGMDVIISSCVGDLRGDETRYAHRTRT